MVPTLLDAPIIDLYHFSRELLITIVLTLWPINRYCSHFLDSRSIVLFTLASLSNDLEIWWSWSSNYTFPCATSWSWHFSSVSMYFGLFLLVRYTRLKDWSRILRYSVIVREITESKCPHNNNQKFEQTIRNGNSVETLTRIASTSRSILERFITSLFPCFDRKWSSYVTQSHSHSSRSDPLPFLPLYFS